MPSRRTLVRAIAAGGLACGLRGDLQGRSPLVDGIVWQPDLDGPSPEGQWDRLGARELLVQWTVADGRSLVPGAGLPMAKRTPDWGRIATRPWAARVVLGLAGRFDEQAARTQLQELLRESLCIVQAPPPVHVAGWYFPVEVDPTWRESPQLLPVLAQLPRPLWISVYDNSNIGPQPIADWLAGWLPRDVGVLFQDGVGVHAREPTVARRYMQAIARRLGSARTRLIAEAFRPLEAARFRAATPDELARQLGAYCGWPVYVFEGPKYLPETSIDALVAARRLDARC